MTATAFDRTTAQIRELIEDEGEWREGPELGRLLGLLAGRRCADLSGLGPQRQAELLGARAAQVLPGVRSLAELLGEGRPLTVKFGIDPTGAEVHLGHAVPMILASRLQRMGHRVVFLVGDVTARIGDPSGRSAERPPLTEEDVRRNVATYRQQVGPFFDFSRAEFRFNSEWLAPMTLPSFLAVLARLPASAALQREDFRTRLAEGSGLTLAELVYSVVMATDSVELAADLELGGLDQLLNLQMCRRVMAAAGQRPEVVLATGLIEGTDGTGAKMSKSKNNYVALGFPAEEMFGRLMACADRLLPGYLRALTELLDGEVELLLAQVGDGRRHPVAAKTLLAAAVTATVHGRTPRSPPGTRSGRGTRCAATPRRGRCPPSTRPRTARPPSATCWSRSAASCPASTRSAGSPRRAASGSSSNTPTARSTPSRSPAPTRTSACSSSSAPTASPARPPPAGCSCAAGGRCWN
ncbi:tyrosine--tRNA ligase [Kitasatospora fiedleri]|uniref:tyrosine--tRNA ligase n=1 Tax=Kitasatospora fiedleri TaxID=2991545 RepID=UPI00249A6A27|nr:tyrosine--tRNA ligase [Kitasatospora fiedleri]